MKNDTKYKLKFHKECFVKKKYLFLFEREQKMSQVVMQRFAGTYHNKMVVLFLIGKGKDRFFVAGHIHEIRCSSK